MTIYSGKDAIKAYYQFPDHPLCGVYNVITGEITFIPCIKDKVEIQEDKDKNYVAGWKIDKYFDHIEALDNETLQRYKQQGYAPRILTSNYDDNFISAHQFLLELMGESKNEAAYRGFTVTPGNTPKYEWTSGSLNSPRDSNGQLIERVRGAQMKEEEQEKIKTIIGNWKPEVKETKTVELDLKSQYAGLTEALKNLIDDLVKRNSGKNKIQRIKTVNEWFTQQEPTQSRVSFCYDLIKKICAKKSGLFSSKSAAFWNTHTKSLNINSVNLQFTEKDLMSISDSKSVESLLNTKTEKDQKKEFPSSFTKP